MCVVCVRVCVRQVVAGKSASSAAAGPVLLEDGGGGSVVVPGASTSPSDPAAVSPPPASATAVSDTTTSGSSSPAATATATATASDDGATAFVLSLSDVRLALGPQLFSREKRLVTLPPGVAAGLAWSALGGDLLYVEATVMPGTGLVKSTGQLGDVMQESIVIAASWIRAHAAAVCVCARVCVRVCVSASCVHACSALRSTVHVGMCACMCVLCKQLLLPADLLDKKDLHVHFPAGAVPKDGPSAGVAIVAALYSLFSKTPLSNAVAMTGEITLTGRVTAVGGAWYLGDDCGAALCAATFWFNCTCLSSCYSQLPLLLPLRYSCCCCCCQRAAAAAAAATTGVREKLLAAYRAGIETVILPSENKEHADDLPAAVKEAMKIVLVDRTMAVVEFLFGIAPPASQQLVLSGGGGGGGGASIVPASTLAALSPPMETLARCAMSLPSRL